MSDADIVRDALETLRNRGFNIVSDRSGEALDRLQARVTELEARLAGKCNHALIAGTTRCIKCGEALAAPTKEGT